MKSIKLILAALLAMAFVATSASAQTTTIHICGSTAYRAPVTKAIQSILKSGYTVAYDSSSATSATAIYGAGAAIFSGNLSSNNDAVVIKTFWTGSLAGVVDLVTQNPLQGKFIPSTVPMVTAANLGNAGANVHGTYTGENGVCDIAMSDSYAASVAKAVSGATVSPNIVVGSSTYSSGASLAAKINSAALLSGSNESVVGVVPFVWETGHLAGSATPPFSNMTQETALTLIKSGFAPLSMLSGTTGDLQNYLFLVGRNEDSGTRIGADAEAQNGFGNATIQYQITFGNNQTTGSGLNTGGANSTVSSLAQWPANAALNTEPNINWNTTGHSGYVAGGDVSNVMASTNTPTAITFTSGEPDAWQAGSAGYIVGYLGLADAVGNGAALSTPQNGGTILSYNGVPFSIEAIQTGAYSFWTFEHLYYITTGGDVQAAANALSDAIYTTYAPTNSSGNTDSAQMQLNSAGIFFDVDSTFYFIRGTEGTEITPNY